MFDFRGRSLTLDLQAFHESRSIEVIVDGESREPIGATLEWRSAKIDFDDPGMHQVALRTEGCRSPRELGVGEDGRCLSFRLRGIEAARLELYDVSSDPMAQIDLSRQLPERVDQMMGYWRSWRPLEVEAATSTELSAESEKTLRTLGYLN